MTFGVRFKEALIYDLTGYPYTINPKHFAENPKKFTKLNEREMASMKPNINDEFAFSMNYESYSSPKCALKRKGYASKMKMHI